MNFLKIKMPSIATKSHLKGLIAYGPQTADGSHDHRYSKGKDRTPAQIRGTEQAQKTKAEQKSE